MKLSLQLITLALSASALARPHHGHNDKQAASFGIQCIRDPINPTRCLEYTGTKYQTRPIHLDLDGDKRSFYHALNSQFPTVKASESYWKAVGLQQPIQRRSPSPIMRPEMVAQRCASRSSSFLCRYLTAPIVAATGEGSGKLSRRNPSPAFDPKIAELFNQFRKHETAPFFYYSSPQQLS